MNLKYKHYSFDLWGTLIKSNPQFKIERTNYFQKHFNKKNRTHAEINNIFLEVGAMCNTINELTGMNIDSLEMYAMVLHKLEYPIENLGTRDLVSIYNVMEPLFFKHHPTIISEDDTRKVLEKIKKSPQRTISVLSNTGFIKGLTLKKLLQQLYISQYFDFYMFSDEIGVSKPNELAFSFLNDRVQRYRKHLSQIMTTDILHIGDNPKADGGAHVLGMDVFILGGKRTMSQITEL